MQRSKGIMFCFVEIFSRSFAAQSVSLVFSRPCFGQFWVCAATLTSMTTLAGGFLVTNYHDTRCKVSKSNLDRGRKQKDHYVKQLLTLDVGDQ